MDSNVLIIDDDEDAIRILHAYLNTWGCTVQTAETGDEGLTLLKKNPPDLVISDIYMPGMTGEEVLAKMQEMGSKVPIILLTAHADIKAAVRSIQNGAFDYITKPIDPESMKIVVERAMEHRRLLEENDKLFEQVQNLAQSKNRLLGDSEAMHQVMFMIKKVARTDSTVLITGETGTGKEVVAQTIHNLSARVAKKLVACNCAALNSNLLESELFGHEKGAFTGASESRKGRFEEAHQGTLYLDEISETEPDFQAKLLRAIQEGAFERVGSSQPIKVDVRLIASSNRDLEAAVQEGTFREDLYYRLAVVPIHLPPLRERGKDVLLLAHAFLAEYNRSFGTQLEGFTEAAHHYIMHHPWPGNVRELRHAVERGVVMATGSTLDTENLKVPHQKKKPSTDQETLQDFQDRTTSEQLLRVLDAHEWNQVQAAKALDIDRSTLYRLLKKYRLQKPD